MQGIVTKLDQFGIWNQLAKVVVFHKNLKSMMNIDNELRLFGAVDVIHVHLIEENVDILTIDFFTKAIREQRLSEATSYLFSDKLRDLKGYSYRVSLMNHYPLHHLIPGTNRANGIDIELIETVFKHQNASAIYTHDEDKTAIWIESANDMKKHRTYFDLFLPPLYELNHLEKFFLPEREEICVTIPNIKRRLLLLQLLRPFQFDVWIFVTGILVVKLIIPKYLPLCLTQSEAYRCLLLYRRLFVLVIVWLEFLCIESYLAKAMAFLATMRYQSPPKTLTDLDELKFPFWVYPAELIILENYKNLRIELVTHHSMTAQKLHQCATIHRCKVAEYWLNHEMNFNLETNDRKFILLEERPYNFAGAYHFARLSPFINKFQQCIGQLFDCGIWYKIQNPWKSSEEHFTTSINMDERYIKFKDLNSLWIMLIVGLSVSLMIFKLEKGAAVIKRTYRNCKHIWKLIKMKTRCRKTKRTLPFALKSH